MVWVDAAGAAPPGSVETDTRFVLGVEGLGAEAERLARESLGSVRFVGTWHTHPTGEAEPSARDRASMADVCTRADPRVERFLMLIVGSPHASEPDLRAYVFTRSEHSPPRS